MTNTIAIIDYGMGNLHSVASAMELVAPDAKIVVSDSPSDILQADRVIFPGVGAIRDCIAELKQRKLDKLVLEVSKTKPMLAICVGMQALMTTSEENEGVDCLNIIEGHVKRFKGEAFVAKAGTDKLKVPHMGWNQVHQLFQHPMFENISQDSRCYFVHSYYIQAGERESVAGSTEYGVVLDSVIARENIFAVQFHPEKSHKVGLQLLKNFSTWSV